MRKNFEIHRDARDLTLRSIVLLRDLDGALRALRESQPGFPTSSSGGGGAASLNDAGKPNGLDRFVVYPDAASRDAAELDELLAIARGAMVKATRIVAVWSAPARPAEEAKPSVAECLACERVVECTSVDRLRAGFCPCLLFVLAALAQGEQGTAPRLACKPTCSSCGCRCTG
jgi:hypothetical protein